MTAHAHSTEETAVSARAHDHRIAGQRASMMVLCLMAARMTVERVDGIATYCVEDHHVGHLVVHWRAEG